MSEIADRRLWLTADGSIVEDGDPAAATLLCAEGDEIPEHVTAPQAHQADDAPVDEAAPKKGRGRAAHTAKPED